MNEIIQMPVKCMEWETHLAYVESFNDEYERLINGIIQSFLIPKELEMGGEYSSSYASIQQWANLRGVNLPEPDLIVGNSSNENP